MRRTLIRLAGLGAVLVLASCGKSAPHATILSLREQELGGAFFPTRILITRRFVRIDPDTGVGNYILFNRQKHVIYSVDAADHTILVIRARPVHLTSPIVLANTVVPLPGTTRFHGHTVRHYHLLTNGRQCYDIEAAKGLLPGAARALIGYERTLAGEQAVTAADSPPGVEGPCGLADNVFDPGREYAEGFPIRITDNDDNTKILIGFQRDVAVKAGLFTLPPHYLRYSPGDVRRSS